MFQFALPYSEAMKIAKKLAHSMSTEETRYYLKGFFVHQADDGKHYAVSTDGHMLTRIEINPSYGEEPDAAAVMTMPKKAEAFPSVIFPAQAVKQMEQIKLSVGERHDSIVFIRIDAEKFRYEIECRGQISGGKLIDGHYPDYQRVIPGAWQSFKNEYGQVGFSPVYLAAIMKAASYNPGRFKADVRPVRFFFEGGSPAVVQEADPSVLYIIMQARTTLPEHKHPTTEATTGSANADGRAA